MQRNGDFSIDFFPIESLFRDDFPLKVQHSKSFVIPRASSKCNFLEEKNEGRNIVIYWRVNLQLQLVNDRYCVFETYCCCRLYFVCNICDDFTP